MSGVARVTMDQFRELLGDPDEGLTIRKSVCARLQRQKRKVTRGERGKPLEDVVQRLDLGDTK